MVAIGNNFLLFTEITPEQIFQCSRYTNIHTHGNCGRDMQILLQQSIKVYLYQTVTFHALNIGFTYCLECDSWPLCVLVKCPTTEL